MYSTPAQLPVTPAEAVINRTLRNNCRLNHRWNEGTPRVIGVIDWIKGQYQRAIAGSEPFRDRTKRELAGFMRADCTRAQVPFKAYRQRTRMRSEDKPSAIASICIWPLWPSIERKITMALP